MSTEYITPETYALADNHSQNGNEVSGNVIQFPLPVAQERPRRLQNWDTYVQAREAANRQEHVEGDDLYSVQDEITEWINDENILAEKPDYLHYDKAVVMAKIGALTDYLEKNLMIRGENEADSTRVVPQEDIVATRMFLESAYEMYESRNQDGSPAEDGDGSFGFLVPARMSRKNTEYGAEVEPVIPALRYVPNEMRAEMMVGLPPFVIDTYKPDHTGRRGYLIYVPGNADMQEDLGGGAAMMVAREHANNAVDFASGALGIHTIGLGATLPAVTRYATKINNPYVTCTTGHAGTTYLIQQTVEHGIRNRIVAPRYKDGKQIAPVIGMIGLGTIGEANAEITAEEHPESQLIIYDTEPEKVQRSFANLSKQGREIRIATDAQELLEESDIIISAIVGKINLRKMPAFDMKGKFIVDDSQPGSFNIKEVFARRGTYSWVIGTDTQHRMPRHDYDYATLADPQTSFFGCEMEAIALSMYRQELLDSGYSLAQAKSKVKRYAVNEAVTPMKVFLMKSLFEKYGFGVDRLQAFGEYVEFDPPFGGYQQEVETHPFGE